MPYQPSEYLKNHGSLEDGGPIYAETNPEHWLVEPWNAFSSLAFLIPAIYWVWKCRKDLASYGFLLYACILLALGGLGSTFYHAFRKFTLLLWMDVLPIAILTLSVSIYFWLRLLPRRWHIVLVLAPFIIMRIVIAKTMSPHDGINAGYFLGGLMIFLPLVMLMARNKFKNLYMILLAGGLMMLALFFRKLDTFSPPVLEMGTHWLWHISAAAGAFWIGGYVYGMTSEKINSH